MSECPFCRIVGGELSARVVLEDEHLMAFHDLAPQAPSHVLVIPKKHVESLAAAGVEDCELLGRLLLAAREVARSLGLEEDGFRTVINSGERAGQSVFHLHVHVLGGRRMGWPPG